MRLILHTTEFFFEGEANILRDLLSAYNFTLHLRKPNATVQEYEKLLQDIPENLHGKIMLHDAFDLIANYSLKGLHFSTSNRHLAKQYTEVYKSTSAHSIHEITELNGKFDYTFLSPIFDSISKKGYKSNFSSEDLRTFLSTPRKYGVIALGGITHDKLSIVNDLGFDGAAVLGAVWQNNAPANQIVLNFKNLYQCIHQDQSV